MEGLSALQGPLSPDWRQKKSKKLVLSVLSGPMSSPARPPFVARARVVAPPYGCVDQSLCLLGLRVKVRVRVSL